jgi:hypothetical protein
MPAFPVNLHRFVVFDHSKSLARLIPEPHFVFHFRGPGRHGKPPSGRLLHFFIPLRELFGGGLSREWHCRLRRKGLGKWAAAVGFQMGANRERSTS